MEWTVLLPLKIHSCYLCRPICLSAILLFSYQWLMLADLSQAQVRWDRNQHADPQDTQVIVPYLVDDGGKYRSHDLLPRRHKRSIDSATSHKIYYKFQAFDEDFHIELQYNNELLSPGFQLYRRRPVLPSNQSVVTSQEELGTEDHCQYQGQLLSHSPSAVALSLCDGLTGLIRTSSGDYLIHPSSSRYSHANSFHGEHKIHGNPTPHVFYKTSYLRNHTQKHFCGDIKNETAGATMTDKAFEHAELLSGRSSRLKRSALRHRLRHREKTVETLVVVDKEMLAAHGDQNVTTYVLTILNMVSNLFSDNTIGNKVKIALVALVLLEGDEPGLVVNKQADSSLHSFCHWQSHLEGSKGTHHDHAILLTGVDICAYSNTNCDTLGFAPIRGMCKRYRSCTINEDTGLATAFTVAHEAGHNFGMFHDGDGNHCSSLAGSIMSPTLSGLDGVVKWSSCSRRYLNRFLRSGQSYCLNDEPRALAELKFPDKLPGEMYDADIQCRWQFGRRARLCMFEFGRDLCKYLWCHIAGNKCETKFLPAAEGTSCGPAMWCRKGVCVSYGAEGPKPVDGKWSRYSDWSVCSRSCGGGVTYKQRFCNNPRPQYGGKECDGEARIYKMCNVHMCPEGSLDFRAQQCAVFNGKPFRGSHYNWKPYTAIAERENLCKLYCKAEKYDFYYALSDRVIDGTRCEDGICVQGKCQIYGCDFVIGSSLRFDTCGVCGGDNTTCSLISGVYNTPINANGTYHQVVIIPKGARSINIEEQDISSNYLAVRDHRGHYFLTGDFTVDWPGEFIFAGTKFLYKRHYNEPESLTGIGPTSEDIIIEVLMQTENKGIHYEYTLPKDSNLTNDMHNIHNYTWSVSTSACSATCATGEQVVTARCLKDHFEEVDERLCDLPLKPKTGVFPCNKQTCPPRWVPQDWQTCSRTCGGGRQKRRTFCMQKVSPTEDRIIKPRKCRYLPRPSRRRVCNTQECPPEWFVGRWSKCSRTCGKGMRTRLVKCKSTQFRGVRELPDRMCNYMSKPKHMDSCELTTCMKKVQWFLSSWTQCSLTCGNGTRKRMLTCSGQDSKGRYRPLPELECRQIPRPKVILQESCIKAKCASPKPRWFLSSWTKCSVTCGRGVQTRLVKCMDESEGKITTGCDPKNKPTTSKSCTMSPCLQRGSVCTDSFSWCHLVPIHQLCAHKFYGAKCCQSCKGSHDNR